LGSKERSFEAVSVELLEGMDEFRGTLAARWWVKDSPLSAAVLDVDAGIELWKITS
jgi:hypothetical protein